MPARMMNNMKSMLRKCWISSHHGKPELTDGAAWATPGYRSMNACTPGSSRRLCATAIRTTRAAAPIGIPHSTLTQRWPMRTRGAIPSCGGSQWLKGGDRPRR